MVSIEYDERKLGPTLAMPEYFKAGSHVWIRDEAEGWVAGIIHSIGGGGKEDGQNQLVKVQFEKNEEIRKFSTISLALESLLPRNNTLGEERIDDLTGLSFLHEASVLNTIKSRYSEGNIYTYSGIVLASINPYCRLAIYEREVIWAYNEHRKEELSPHIFGIAEDAFRSMCITGKSQSIIVSGESGAGKTKSAKYIMRYLAEVCSANTFTSSFSLPSIMDKANDSMPGEKRTTTTIEDRVLATNPILEAFGNAKTIRNDNSSRFGKYMQIFFNKENFIVGAGIKTYLLEKTRVVTQAKNERNFHIFYQLLCGCPEDYRKDFELSTWSDYKYLSNSENGIISEVDDQVEFDLTRKAMGVAGFPESQQWEIFRVLAAILHLGNVDFVEDADNHALISEESASSIKVAARLLGISPIELEHNLLRRSIVAAHETVEAFNNSIRAQATRDALAKFLYSKVFLCIVNGLNMKLVPSFKCERFIGVLDIYGFEKFNVNSFEQFCINYANEKLQHLFNLHVFQLEQILYTEEGIDWSFIPFYDNQRCIDLIEAKMGILDLLDEECRFPNGTDASFVEKIYNRHCKTEESGQFLSKAKFLEKEKFAIKHFAYEVEYSADGFIEKNRDSIPLELLVLLEKSTLEFIQSLVPLGLKFEPESIEAPPSKDGGGGMDKMKDLRTNSFNGGGKPSTGLAFKQSLGSLMDIIISTQSHYIRCIKPNQSKEPMKFDAPFVIQQLKACGILETVRISAAGYPGRWPFKDFLDRFALLATKPIELLTVDNDERNACLKLLEEFKMTPEHFQLGKTRIFMRSGILAALEEARTAKLVYSATFIQSFTRSKTTKFEFKRILSLTILIESFGRVIMAKAKYQAFLSEHWGKILGSHVRRFLSKKTFSNFIKAMKLVCNYQRFHTERIKFRTLLMVKSTIRLQSWRKSYRERSLYQAKLLISLAIQSKYRRNESWTRLLKLKEEARSMEHLKGTLALLTNRIEGLTTKLKLADESLDHERKVNESLQRELLSMTLDKEQKVPQKESSPPHPPTLRLEEEQSLLIGALRGELENAQIRIESFETIVENLERANSELFERNEELAKQIRIYRLERLNADRLSKSNQNPKLSKSTIGRDGYDDTTNDSSKYGKRHTRVLSLDSKSSILLDGLEPLDTFHPTVTSSNGTGNAAGAGTGTIGGGILYANVTDKKDLCDALDDSNCLKELLSMIEGVQKLTTNQDNDVLNKTTIRLPVRILEQWILSWIDVDSNSTIIKSYLSEALSQIKLSCINNYENNNKKSFGKVEHLRTRTVPTVGERIPSSSSSPSSPISSAFTVDRCFAFWIGNLFDFLCFLQWEVTDLNDREVELNISNQNECPPKLSERMIVLLQMRTDVAWIVEELCRAWLNILFKFFNRLGVAALLDHQGLAGFSTDSSFPSSPYRSDSGSNGTQYDDGNQRNSQDKHQTSSSSLKMLMLPFTKLTSQSSIRSNLGNGNTGAANPQAIEDLIESLDELANCMRANYLQPELSTQLLSLVIGNFSNAAFNQLLLRKNYASWRRGIQIQYNLSRLEEWASTLNSRNPNYFFSFSNLPSPTTTTTAAVNINVHVTTANSSSNSGDDEQVDQGYNNDNDNDNTRYHSVKTTSPLIQIEPLIQAVKLLQLAKTRVASDLDVLLEACPKLNLAQIRKILSVYVPDVYEDGPVAPEILRSLTLRIQQSQYDTKVGPFLETLPELQPQTLPFHLSIKPIPPVSFSALPTTTALVPPHLWRIFALVDSKRSKKQR